MIFTKVLVLTLLLSVIYCQIRKVEDQIEAEIEIMLNSPKIGHKVLKINGTQLMDFNKKLLDITHCVKETSSDSSLILVVVLIENFLLLA